MSHQLSQRRRPQPQGNLFDVVWVRVTCTVLGCMAIGAVVGVLVWRIMQ